jgi:Zn-dependent peptidase ImmA (M78 family)
MAERAGMTQAALSRYEANLREPDTGTVGRLAEALGLTTEFLSRSQGSYGAMAVDAHMRRAKTAKASVWKQLEADLNEARMHSALLSDHVTLHAPQSIPTFDPVDVDPEEAARLVRMQWRMPIGAVQNLTGWMEAAGCWIIEREWGTNRVDGLSQWIGDRPIILLNSSVPTDRKRLTLAHELGHLVLHSKEIVEAVEDQANAFAAEFLMPIEVIRPRLRNLRMDNLAALKREWGVSMAAIVERAYRARLMKAGERQSLYRRFSALGWRTSEPISDELRPERPTVLYEVSRLLRENGFTEDEIARLAGYATRAMNDLVVAAPSRTLRAV